MSGKNKDKLTDLEADFFGEEDLDWLDEDSEVIEKPADGAGGPVKRRRRPSADPTKILPPPPPPFAPPAGAGGSVVPRSKSEADRRRGGPRPLLDPAELSRADTLIYAQESQPDDEVTVSGARAPTPDLGDEDLPTASADLPPSPSGSPATSLWPLGAPPAPASPPTLAPYDESDEAVFADEGPAEEPLVRTHDPAPARMELPDAPPAAVDPIPSSPPFAPVLAPSGEAAWRDAATALISESAALGGEAGAELLYRAGWIYHHELADHYGAESLYRDALGAGSRNPSLYRDFADLCIQLGRWSEAADLLHERAGVLDGPAAAESLRECASIALRKLQNAGIGVARLWDAVAASPTDYASLSMIRDNLSDVQPERADVLQRLATLSEGAVAAQAWTERGRMLEAIAPEQAPEAYRSALRADPDHGAAWLALEAHCTRARDHEALADLYDAEAVADVAGAGWWCLLAGRARLASGALERGAASFRGAIERGWGFAEQELLAGLMSAAVRAGGEEGWRLVASELEASCARHPDASSTPFAWFELGWIREVHLGDLNGAVTAYRHAAVDRAAIPATDAIRRVLRRLGDRDALVDALRALLPQTTSDARRKLILFRLAETSEDAGQLDEARAGYQAVLEVDPRSVSAMAGLGRVLQRLGAWDELRALRVRRAEVVDGADLKAHFLYEAAAVGRQPEGDAEDALRLYLAALEQVPDHLAALEGATSLLAAAGRWAELAGALQAAADATADRRLQIDLSYRAGRVLGLYTDDRAGARRCLTACLEIDADFEPALQLAMDLAAADGDTHRISAWYRGMAGRESDAAVRDWARFAAAVTAGLHTEVARSDLHALLGQAPDHAGGRAAWERHALIAADGAALADLCRAALLGPADADRARTALRFADLLAAQGRTEDAASVLDDLSAMDVGSRPLRAAARLAVAQGHQALAVKLLAGIPEPWATVERLGLLAHRRRDRDVARKEVFALLQSDDAGLGVAHVGAQVGAALEDAALCAVAQERLARRAGTPEMRAACAMGAASHYEAIERTDRAAAMYALALEAAPGSGAAAAGVLRCHARAGDAGGLLTVADGPQVDPIAVGSALRRVGDTAACVEVLEGAADRAPSLALLLHLERAQEDGGDWSGAYRTLVRRLDLTRDPTQRQILERKRRWVLAERLSHTDEAWELYQQLHRETPGDREVLEALSRIAATRGELARSVEYLAELSRGAASPADSARIQRRIADVHLQGGDRDAARRALLDALDYVPTDPDALAGLRAMATEDEDWPGLVQILQREADLVRGERLVDVRREIARIDEERLRQGRVAIEAWRAVLELVPQDEEALSRLLPLAESEGEWGVFVEAGNVLAALARGAERTGLLRRIGVVCAEHLKRDDAIRYFDQAISEEPPDLEAARRLEETWRKRSDWKGVARALEVQGRVATTPEERVAALTRAAKLELETRHDRDAAAVHYRKVLEVDAHDEPALRFMAGHLFEAGRFDEALPVCERLEPVVERGQDLEDFDTRMELAQFYFYFAEMLRLAGDDGAMKRYARALELNPTHLASLEAVGPMYASAKQWKKAEWVYRQLLQLSGGQGERHKVAETYTQLGLVERALGSSDKAQKRFNKALEIYPNHVEALKGMALLLEDKEDWSNLLNIYNNIIYHATVAEDVIDAYMTKGRILDDHMARPDKAAQHYQRSLDFKADQPIALLRMAELAMRRDNHQGAGEFADRGLRIDRDDARAVRPLLLLCRAASLHDAGRSEDAQLALAEARATEVGKQLGAGALDDLEKLRQWIKEQIPR